MEGAESKSPTMTQEDSQISPEISVTLADTIKRFQESLKVILDEIERLKRDESFSEITAETYNIKKSNLRKQLIELTRLHRLLARQHVNLMEEVSKNCPSLIKYQHLDFSDSDSSQVIQMLTLCRKSDLLKLRTPSGFDHVLKVKETTPAEVQKLVVGKTVTTESSHLETVIELQKQVAELKLEISSSDAKIKTMEGMLEASRKKLSIARDAIANLKGEQSSKLFKENQSYKSELESCWNLISKARMQLDVQTIKYKDMEKELKACAVSVVERDEQVAKLNARNEQYKSEISKLEDTLKSKDATWSKDVARLKGELRNKSKSLDEMKKRFENMRSEKYRVSGQLDNLEAEKCSQDKQIQELETHLNELKAEHERVVLEFENAEKLNNELELNAVELEREVDRLREVISVITEEKMEAIRQLTSSLEHYISTYKQLQQSYVAYKTRCFGILSCLDTH